MVLKIWPTALPLRAPGEQERYVKARFSARLPLGRWALLDFRSVPPAAPRHGAAREAVRPRAP